MTGAEPGLRPVGVGGQRALGIVFCAFTLLLLAGFVLGVDWNGTVLAGRAHRALVPHAAVLLAPAGALLILIFGARLAGTWPFERGARRHLVVSGVAGAFGLALIGFGVGAVDAARAWRVLVLPLVLAVFTGIGWTFLHGPSRRAYWTQARARWGATAYLHPPVGLLLLALCPVWGAWCLGVITL